MYFNVKYKCIHTIKGSVVRRGGSSLTRPYILRHKSERYFRQTTAGEGIVGTLVTCYQSCFFPQIPPAREVYKLGKSTRGEAAHANKQTKKLGGERGWCLLSNKSAWKREGGGRLIEGYNFGWWRVYGPDQETYFILLSPIWIGSVP